MKLPWVSRKRFVKVLRKSKSLKLEIERLQRVIEADAAVIRSAEAKIALLETAAPAQPVQTGVFGGKPKLEDVIAFANKGAQIRAASGGDSVITELNQAAFRGRRDVKHG